MTEHPNVVRTREGYTAFAKGDLAAFDELWNDDITWHNAGRSQVSGTFHGRPAIFEMFGRLVELSEGSFRAEPQAIVGDDDWVCAVVTVSAHRGNRSVESMEVHTLRMADGKVSEFWATSTQPYELDEFFG